MSQATIEQHHFRRVCSKYATGITILTVLDADGAPQGMTVNSFTSVSLDPPLVLVSLDNRSHMHRILPSAGQYGISVLAEDQRALGDHFAGCANEPVHVSFVSRVGMPLLDGAVAYFVVRLVATHLAGDHTLYVGKVEHFESRGDKPLLFYAGSYQQLARGG